MLPIEETFWKKIYLPRFPKNWGRKWKCLYLKATATTAGSVWEDTRSSKLCASIIMIHVWTSRDYRQNINLDLSCICQYFSLSQASFSSYNIMLQQFRVFPVIKLRCYIKQSTTRQIMKSVYNSMYRAKRTA
jgi:hypothetical protein